MKTLKFNVLNQEHSKQIQDAIFLLGGGWNILGEYNISQEYQHVDKPFLWVESETKFDQFGNTTDEKYLSLMYSEVEKDNYNYADHVDEKVARRTPSDLSVNYDVTLDNFREHLHKIGFRSKKENLSDI
ncbi:hypothetical protein R4575_17020 [Acinetobacter baumannii]|nr:hypothetical protein [Acinetobacter baumannii]